MSGKIRVIVCGTTFGQHYLKALEQLRGQFEVAGLFAKGSERSRLCAEKHNIPLYTSMADLPEDIDLACVVIRSGAIGGKGTEVALQFLEKGISVIQEQPIHPKDLELCHRTARKHKVHFMTGDLYPNLPEVERFITIARELNKTEAPVYVNASFAPQVSYPAMDILMQALPSVRNWKIYHLTQEVGPFDVLVGELGSIPITIEYHNQINPHDPDNYMHLLHNIALVYESGRLTLEDTFGPVTWKPRMHIPTLLYNTANAEETYPAYLDENSMEILGDYKSRSFKSVVTQGWPYAISKDLISVRELILGEKNVNQKAQQEILCALQWTEMTKTFGYARLTEDDERHYTPFQMIKMTADSIK